MTWSDLLSGILKKPAERWIYETIPKERTPSTEDPVPIMPDRSYLRVKLTHMYLEYERVWTQNRVPVVHAYPRFDSCQGRMDMPVIVGPSKLKAEDGQHLHRVMTLNQTVLGPIPYIGGDLELILALFAAPTENYADDFFELLGDLSALVPSVGLKGVAAVIHPIENGLEKMAGLGDTIQLGVQDTFSNPTAGDVVNPLMSGYRVLVGHSEKEIDPHSLWVTHDGIRLDKNGAPGDLLTSCDYLVFRIECIAERDWRELDTLNSNWRRVETAVETCQGKTDGIETAFKMFGYDLIGCGDLQISQRTKVLQAQKLAKDEMISALGILSEAKPTKTRGPAKRKTMAAPPIAFPAKAAHGVAELFGDEINNAVIANLK